MVNFFDQIVTNFEDSMRGLTKINNRKVKAFPNIAGSVFISKVVSLLKTIINDRNVYSQLDYRTTKERIYRNGKALNIMMVLDETVEIEDMLFIFEGFQNISIDTYLGMKESGKYGNLQKDLRQDNEIEEDDKHEIVT